MKLHKNFGIVPIANNSLTIIQPIVPTPKS